ncbi:I78 family peptidase inhibitor [Paracoccus sp. MBLB3053]|uniref:I78 family peptidase inhibitor n=1 Tax=Paracoccus aurantius TaxID=3073814 RepID=A0ABU2HQV9_9RHOB|nr:I78 family peptidase inhibitor [Paracoccus sp. MBLB3053]MDS9466950.1 I78 family peptidase inhibitor [Paracoccus sp. MBLB3053]
MYPVAALLALSLVTLTGCTNVASSADAKVDCGAEALRGLVGQPRAVLEQVDLPEGSRVIGAKQAVTMDFRPTRLNVEIGADDRIARLGCY